VSSWRVYLERADDDEPRRFIGMAQGGSQAQALDNAAQLYEIPSHDLVVQPASEKDLQALKAAEDHVIDIYTSYTRNTTARWGFDDAERAKLRYNDSPGRKDGYLTAGVQSSRIVEYQAEPDEQWDIEVIPDVGIALDPEVYTVYQALNGEWIVEQ
jgi:hypothetical protein